MRTLRAAYRLLLSVLHLFKNLFILFLLSLRLTFQLFSASLLRRKRQIKNLLRRGKNMGGNEIFTETMEVPAAAGDQIPEPTQSGQDTAQTIQNGGGPSQSVSFSDVEELTPLCEDLIQIPFEAWDSFSLGEVCLTPQESGKLGRRLARMMIKYPELKDKITDEVLFAGSLIVAVGKRLKSERQHRATRDHREGRNGKDDTRKDDHPASS